MIHVITTHQTTANPLAIKYTKMITVIIHYITINYNVVHFLLIIKMIHRIIIHRITVHLL